MVKRDLRSEVSIYPIGTPFASVAVSNVLAQKQRTYAY